MKYIKPYSESVKQYLTPKSEEDIIKNVQYLPPYRKLQKGSRYDILKLVKQGVEEGAKPDNFILIIACENGSINVVKYLLNFDINLIEDGLNVFTNSVIFNHYDIVKLLLDNDRVDPTYNNNEASYYAAIYGFYDILELLINDERVKNSLSPTLLSRYENSIKQNKKDKSMNESFNSKFDREYKKTGSDFYYMKKYNLSVRIIYSLVEEIINDGCFSQTIEPTESNIMLMTNCALSVMLKESKEKVKIIFDSAIKNGIDQNDIDILIKQLKTVQEILVEIAKDYNLNISTTEDMLFNNQILIPFISVLVSLINYDKLDCKILLKSLSEIKSELGQEKYDLFIDRIDRKLKIMVSGTSKFQNIKNIKPYKTSTEFNPINQRTKRIRF